MKKNERLEWVLMMTILTLIIIGVNFMSFAAMYVAAALILVLGWYERQLYKRSFKFLKMKFKVKEEE